ncbi:MAG TPA: general secretion pathway protein [Flavobacterium sp.]|uniref:general secretion pathway protein n=1 Tax=unclassified Flavobacterium TaxID=196869 RepID=UPI000E971789|nr:MULTISPECIES: general secretion pathway protein [unclassified Flavobacterium]HBI02253.1 general secretion pathway protein [Flavobacterium sp.]HRE76414.1 general secretion pathway protein [Flavobacterium sp.]
MKLNRKNKILLVGFFMVLLICYSLGFSKTIDYYQRYKAESELLKDSSGNSELVKKLLAKQKQLNQVLEQNDFKGETSFQNELLKNLNASIENTEVKITDFKEEHLFADKGSTTVSYLFTLEGSFNNVLKTINHIENKPYLGIVKHVSVNKKMNYSTNSFYLQTQVLLQRSLGE